MEVRDKGIHLALIPFFGIVIPNLTGVLGDLESQSPKYWASYPYFILLSFLVWQGNRFFSSSSENISIGSIIQFEKSLCCCWSVSFTRLLWLS